MLVAPELVAFVNALPTPYVLLSPALIIEAASEAYLQATLMTRERLVGQYMFDAFPDNPQTPDAQGTYTVRASLLQVLATGQPHALAQQHYDVPDPDHPGQFVERHWQALNTPVLDAQGHVVQLIHSALDITAEVQARARLRASQAAEQVALAEALRQRARLYGVFEQAPGMICILQGPEHVFEFANPPYRALMGGRPLVGRAFAEALPELAGQGIFEDLDQVYRTGESCYASERPVHLDHDNNGQLALRYYNFVWQARRDPAGAVDGVLVFAYDVTPQVLARHQVEQLNAELEVRVQARTQEARQAQAAAERERARFQAIIAQAPVAIGLFTGEEVRIAALNAPMAALFGYPAEQLLGQPLLEAMPELRGQGFDDLLRQVQATRVPFVGQEMPVTLRHEGKDQVSYYNLVYQPLYDEAGRVLGVIEVAADVTEQVRARQQVQDLNEELAAINEEMMATNEELNESNTQLTRTNVDLDTFVYTASHDLKAPITNIEGILEALRETLPPGVQQEAMVAQLLRLLDNTVGRFLTTIDQLTDLARLQRTYNEPAEQLALAPVVAGVLADLAPLVEAAPAQVQLDVPAGLHVSFAPASLRSIVYNLLSNAVKYRDPTRPAQVWLRAEAQPGAVVLSVRDNGLGLSASQQGRLFGVFQRMHTHVAGTGVGLYMIKRLIENAGARIAVASAPGSGSTFTVTFPA